MSLVQVTVMEGSFSEQEKRDLIRKVTDAVVSVKGDYVRPFTWVLIEETKNPDWGIGGTAMTLDAIKSLPLASQ